MYKKYSPSLLFRQTATGSTEFF